MQTKSVQQNKTYKTTLYRVVFDSLYVKVAVLCLFVLLLLQPVAPAFASFDEDVISESSLSDVASSEVENVSPVSEVSITEEVDEEIVVPEAEVENVLVEAPVEQEDATVTSQLVLTEVVSISSTTDDVVSEIETGVDELMATTSADTPILPDTSASSTEEVEIIDTEFPTEEATSTAEEENVDQSPVLASTTASSSVEVAVVEHISHAFEFNTDECAVVGDGAYYCSSPENSPDPLKDGVFSAPDSGGDLEIYVRLNGEESIITSNTVDDSAPYYDAVSERIVWHSIQNDRYQIVSYDTKTEKTSYITNSSYNNMEPVAFGDITLWQAWIDNNWEIMLYDGSSSTRLTHNAVQDVSPHMRGGYIVWQTQFADGWQVAVYDQKTKSIEYIESEGGLKVENPRFVLVYDSTNDQGDVQTVGYDLDKKVTFTLGSLPAQLPDELPSPEQTGETRALIQNKQTSREGEGEIIDLPQISSGNGTSSTSTPGTLDLSQGSSTPAVSATTSVPAVDIVVPPFSASNTIDTLPVEIPDIVIPPLSGTTTLEIS